MNTESGKISTRIDALDALRGFDMFWIVGGSAFVITLANFTDIAWLKGLSMQLRHVPWEGFHFIDLVFPLFMFISGAVIPFSIVSKLERGEPKNKILIKAAKRMLLLVILGIVYNGALQNGFTDARYASVLGQIGLAFFFSVLIIIYTKSLKTRLFWLIGILSGITLLQLFVPVPGIGAGILTPEGCINGYLDRLILPGRIPYGKDGWMSTGQGLFEPEGILSIVSSTGITLMGTFAGFILKTRRYRELKKVIILLITGAGLTLLAIALHPVYPIIKNCWTTTFSLITGGISFLLLGIFYLVIDVWGWKKWSFYFRIIGMNPLFIYLFYKMVKIRDTSVFLFGWLTGDYENKSSHPVVTFGAILLVWGLLYFLYKRKIFIRI